MCLQASALPHCSRRGSPAPKTATGYFVIDENDQGISAMYTGPSASPNVGSGVYRDVGAASRYHLVGGRNECPHRVLVWRPRLEDQLEEGKVVLKCARNEGAVSCVV